MVRVAGRAARVRADVSLAALDALLICGAYVAVLLLRFDGSVPSSYWDGFRAYLPLALAVHLGANAMSGLYGQVWRHASVAEARRVVIAAASGFGLILAGLLIIGRGGLPLSVSLTGAMLAPMLVGLLRFQTRLFAVKRRTTDGPAMTRVVVIGASDAGSRLIREMLDCPGMGLKPVAAVDDDLRFVGRSLGAVPVYGPIDMLPDAARRHGAQQAVLAIPGADGELVRRVANLADEVGIPLKIIPGTRTIVGGDLSLRDVRDLEITDLLGRRQIETDLEQVRATLAGRRVLITGAGGSIGSEILRQVAGFEPAALIALDQDETHLFDAAAGVDGRCTQVLADVRDAALIRRVFAQHQPDVVFHAAALKHVPILEAHPAQAIATNVVGTRNVVEAAKAVGVARLVLISTDKAVNPSSVMGATKQLAERIVLSEAPRGAAWSAVRFGNVLGSRGSVVPTFMRQIAGGGPVTITHREMTRYFMSIPEAVELVLQAGALSQGSDLFMLDMGQPVKIVDLAERMIRLSGRQPEVDIPIVVTGMRPGEKLAEELRTATEPVQPTAHPSIQRLLIDAQDHGPVLAPGSALDDQAARRCLDDLVFDRVLVLPDAESVR